MDVVKKHIAALKQHQKYYKDVHISEEDLDNINLLNTIKVPKNLTQLTKNLPKSNYMSTRESKFAEQ